VAKLKETKMNNSPDKPRHDRRMHEGRKPGLDDSEKTGRLVDVAKKDGSTSQMDRPDPMDPDATIRSNA
jgi:hypothetical protein